MFYKVLLRSEDVTLPLLDKKDLIQIIINIENNSIPMELICLSLDRAGYGLKDFCASSLDSSEETSEAGIQWLPVSRRDKPGSRTLSIAPHTFPEELHTISIFIGTLNQNVLEQPLRGSIQIRCGIQTWEWLLQDTLAGSASAFKLINLQRQRNTWLATFINQPLKESLNTYIERVMTPPQFNEGNLLEASSKPSLALKSSPSSSPTHLPEPLLRQYQLAVEYLKKFDIVNHPIRCIVVLDYTSKTKPFYEGGDIAHFLQSLAGLAAHSSSDGKLEVFLAGQQIIPAGTVSWDTSSACIAEWLSAYPMGERLQYGRFIEAVRNAVYPINQGGPTKQICRGEEPVWIFCMVSHEADDAPFAQWQLRWASKEPIFWQFLGLSGQPYAQNTFSAFIRQNKNTGEFSFLRHLTELSGCEIPNADYATLRGIEGIQLDTLYAGFIESYSAWIKEGVQRGMLAGHASGCLDMFSSVKNDIFD